MIGKFATYRSSRMPIKVNATEPGAGKLVGSKEQQAKGLQKQVTGTAEKAFGAVKEAVKDTVGKH